MDLRQDFGGGSVRVPLPPGPPADGLAGTGARRSGAAPAHPPAGRQVQAPRRARRGTGQDHLHPRSRQAGGRDMPGAPGQPSYPTQVATLCQLGRAPTSRSDTRPPSTLLVRGWRDSLLACLMWCLAGAGNTCVVPPYRGVREVDRLCACLSTSHLSWWAVVGWQVVQPTAHAPSRGCR